MSRRPLRTMLSSLIVVMLAATMASAQYKLDHFQIYKVKPERLPAKFTLRGQFDENPVQHSVGDLQFFANPVAKDRGVINDKNAHLTWYALGKSKPEPQRVVAIENQFGKQELLLDRPVLLAQPALKKGEGATFPEKLDHFKCYRVLKGKPIGREVHLVDQFGESTVKVTTPTLFCVPVEKRHKDKVFPIINAKDHLTVYRIGGKPLEKQIDVADQFSQPASRPVAVLGPAMLAVPTTKLKVSVQKSEDGPRPRLKSDAEQPKKPEA